MSDDAAFEVAVDQPVDRTFTYLIPEKMIHKAAVGMRALVPFGRRKVTGYILGPAKKTIVEGLKEVEAWLDTEPVFDGKMLELLRWISSYYLAPLGGVIKTALPSGINAASFQVARLSENLPDISSYSGKEKALIAYIAETGESSLKEIEKRFGSLSTFYRLVKKGTVEIEGRVVSGRVKTKKMRCVALLPGDDVKEAGQCRRAPEIIDYLRDHGEVPLRQLIGDMATTAKTISKLEELGIVNFFEKEVYRDPYMVPVEKVDPPQLTSHQSSVMSEISEAIEKRNFAPFLLDGKTGSGKTEIYIRAIEMAGGSGIVLIPEISLTPQLSARFRERFGDRVSVLHSGLSDGERYDQWRKIREGKCDIVVGARSAIFAPIKDVRVIIVDEEHEQTYKQEEGVRYHARDLALVRGKKANAVVILGSATPSLESKRNVAEGKLTCLSLPERISARPMPTVEVVDMRQEKRKKKELGWWMSRRLHVLVEETLEKKEQVLLFLNRRGFAPTIICRDCGHSFRCPHCSVTLTWHREKGSLRCHYCDYRMRALPQCPECNGDNVDGLGMGTERLEEEIGALFEGAKVARMDRDTVKGRGSVERLLHAFKSGEIDILIGTQMVAKGHHFPNVTLVGALMADMSLNVPDFRAAERTFQLLTQVSGRAGRGESPGKVVIQSYIPDHYAILHGGEEDSATFYEKEMALRKEFSYPPFSRLINLRIEGSDEGRVTQCCARLKEVARKVLKNYKNLDISILGPASSPMSRIKRKFRWQMLVKSGESALLHRFVRKVISEMGSGGRTPAGVRITPDIDPFSLL